MEEIQTKRKTYQALLKLGTQTDTGDTEGKIIKEAAIPELTPEKLAAVEKKFVGTHMQTPPQFSAKKVNGKSAYKYARKGIKVELKAKEITIHSLKIDNTNIDEILFTVSCSSGTYIRVLGEEIAEALGTVGHLETLTRTSIGEYHIQKAVTPDEIEKELQYEKNILELQQKEASLN